MCKVKEKKYKAVKNGSLVSYSRYRKQVVEGRRGRPGVAVGEQENMKPKRMVDSLVPADPFPDAPMPFAVVAACVGLVSFMQLRTVRSGTGRSGTDLRGEQGRSCTENPTLPLVPIQAPLQAPPHHGALALSHD